MASTQLSPQTITEDIKQHKIKEGWMAKKSRYIKEWRERWIVLTKNYMYSFEHKQVYTKPTEILPVCDIETLKSYFKQQQEKEWSFRAENKNVNFYLAGKTNQEKWAWMTAIERAIDRNHNGTVDDKERVIEKMRDTFLAKEKETAMYARPSFMAPPVVKKELKEFKLEKIRIQPYLSSTSTGSIKSSQNLKPSKTENIVIKASVSSISPQLSVAEKAKQFEGRIETKIVERIVEVEKIVEVQKIVQRVVEKIVQVPIERKLQSSSLPQLTKTATIQSLFSGILSAPIKFDFLVQFLVSLSVEQKLQYCNSIIQTCLTHKNGRYFSQALLILYNQQTDEEVLNGILKFIIQIYDQTEEYFYITDLKVLIDILCRELELYRSDVNHYLMLQLIKNLCIKESWPKLQGYRLGDIKNLVEEINGLTGSSANKDLSKELMQYL